MSLSQNKNHSVVSWEGKCRDYFIYDLIYFTGQNIPGYDHKRKELKVEKQHL